MCLNLNNIKEYLKALLKVLVKNWLLNEKNMRELSAFE